MNNHRLLIAAALTAALGLAGCGKLGSLDRPGPLFDNHARSQKQAEREAAARASGEKSGDSATSQTNGDYSQASDGAKDPALAPIRSDLFPVTPQGPLAGKVGGVLPDPYANPNTAPAMNFFQVHDGELYCEDVPLRRIADEVGTPVYVYSTATLERHYTVFRDAFAPRKVLVAYAVKANSNLSVLKTLAKLGAGADTVSEGEIRRALAAGVRPDRIVFSGVGKTRRELAFAVQAGVAEINVESEPELDALAEVAELLDARPQITIRVNPDVAAGGHAKIATGKSDNKFGVSFSEAERLYAKASASPHLQPIGVACHIGSQISDLKPMAQAFAKMRGLVERLRAQGLQVPRLDLGGGLGAPYFDLPDPPSPAEFAAMVEEVMEGLDIELVFEPGRVIAANAGILLSRVIHVHERPEGRRFLVVDGAMNDLVRPAMYDAFHDIRPVSEPRPGANLAAYDVVGPVCETGDTFSRDHALPPLGAGDLIAFMTAGAYGAAMSSEYNTRPLVPEVLVSGDQYAVVRPRPTYDEMLEREPLAPWL